MEPDSEIIVLLENQLGHMRITGCIMNTVGAIFFLGSRLLRVAPSRRWTSPHVIASIACSGGEHVRGGAPDTPARHSDRTLAEALRILVGCCCFNVLRSLLHGVLLAGHAANLVNGGYTFDFHAALLGIDAGIDATPFGSRETCCDVAKLQWHRCHSPTLYGHRWHL